MKSIDVQSQKIFGELITKHAPEIAPYLNGDAKLDLLIREAMADAFICGTQFGFRTASEAMGIELRGGAK